MPIYDFNCDTCGPFATMRRIAERDRLALCPDCGSAASRLVTAPPLALMSGERRVAHATNERASHAPRQSGELAPAKHRPGCGCCSGARTTLAGASGGAAGGGGSGLAGAAVGGLKRPAGRPWMISH
ncbi:FmdB family zinc ribbon protein [Burkholderia mayonis]|uniref:FmdB family transcriptional regulator n=1 Tax=Burkholderia mayonis TaxID=1385591 RepID=A0A1B4FTI3_9BURK|nr:zinc ribbon domain-containing protein [Burkholderia mayonis]AOJ06990.1 FmdB family transcriptional regulator [Burkholderia mayonis]KVE52655.1 FmdB family transcriptional regulator [Burkholderia mayonis]